MNKKKLILLILALTLALSLSACGKKEEQAVENPYPEKNVTMVVPYGAGGTTDLAGRALANALEKELGVTVVVENQAGASGAVGTEAVMSAKHDGYTLLLSADSLGTQRVMGLSDYSYHDFAVISPVTNDPKVIVVAADSEYRIIEDLLLDMKARPGKVQMSYTGPGGSGHIQSLIYNKLGYEMALTAYSGGKDCIVSVLGHDTQFTNSNYSTVRPYLEAGTLRLLAVSDMNRIAEYPDVPTLREIIPGSEQYFCVEFTPLTLLVPDDTPEAVVKTLREATDKALHSEEFLSYAEENSLDCLFDTYKTEEERAAYYDSWESYVSWLLYDAGASQRSPEEFDIPRP